MLGTELVFGETVINIEEQCVRLTDFVLNIQLCIICLFYAVVLFGCWFIYCFIYLFAR